MANPRQVIDPQLPSVSLRPAAASSGVNITPAGVDPELNGLLEGLSTLNPALKQYTAAKQQADYLQTQADLANAKDEGKALGESFTGDKRKLVTEGVPQEYIPPNMNPAVVPAFTQQVSMNVAKRLGEDSATAYLQDATEKMNDLNFLPQVGNHYHESLNAALAGVSDTHDRAEIVKSFEKTYPQVAQHAVSMGQKASKEAANTIIQGTLADISKLPTSAEQFQQFDKSVKDFRAFGGFYSIPEITKSFLDVMTARSTEQGGRPELFDVFMSHKIPSLGMTIADANGLGDEVATRKKAAQELHDKNMDKANEVSNGTLMMNTEEGWKVGQFMPDSWFTGQIGVGKLFSNDEQMMGAWRRQQEAKDKFSVDTNLLQAIDGGTLWTFSEKLQKQAMELMDDRIGQNIREFYKPGVPNGTDWPAVDRMTANFVKVADKLGADVKSTRLTSLLNSVVNAVPDTSKGAPQIPDNYHLAYRVWKGLTPALRSKYAGDDAGTVFHLYGQAVDSGVDHGTAYAQALRGISPEAKASAEAMRKDPQVTLKIRESVQSTFGSYLLPRFAESWLGMQPRNLDEVSRHVTSKLVLLAQANPKMSQEQLMEKAEALTKQYVVMDKVNKVGLVLPEPISAPNLAEAIAERTKALQEKYPEFTQDGYRVGFDVVDTAPVRLGVYTWEDNRMTAMLNEPVLSVDDLMGDYWHARNVTPEDAAALYQVNKKLIMGTLSPTDVTEYAPIIMKAKKYDFLTPQLREALQETSEKGFRLRAAARIGLAISPSDEVIPTRKVHNSALPSEVSQAAMSLYQSGKPGMALTAMRENMVLKASEDPNRQAGTNIGFGYNFKANAATIEKDFMAAGIPKERIADVKAGIASITPDQATNLLKVTYPRYEEAAKKAVNSTKAGGWELLSDVDRAVLTDIAYQTGAVGSFEKTINSMLFAEGDQAQAQAKVHYKKDGRWVEDKYGNNWRSNYYRNPHSFATFIQQAAR